MAGVALIVSQRRKHTLVSPFAKPPAAFCRHELTRLARHNQRTWPPLFASRLWNKLLASHGELPTSKRLYGHLICAAWLKKESRRSGSFSLLLSFPLLIPCPFALSRRLDNECIWDTSQRQGNYLPRRVRPVVFISALQTCIRDVVVVTYHVARLIAPAI